MIRFRLALAAGGLVDKILKITPNRGGTMLSGKAALKIDPNILSHFSGIDLSRVLFVTGTNGKSSTTNLITHVLRANGYKVISNTEGANLMSGVATALMKESDGAGHVGADYYIFETDERFLPAIREQLPAANILITNLQKDQVQRNGDPDFIYRHLSKAFEGGVPRLFVNNEEPRAASLSKYADAAVRYGVQRHGRSFEKGSSYVTMACPNCRHGISFAYYNTDGVGTFKCRGCGFESKTADYSVSDADFDSLSFSINGVRFPMPYESPFMLYNYAACAAVARELCDIPMEKIAEAFESFKNIGGRYEVLSYKGKTIKYMRMKQENPETLQSSLNVIADDPEQKLVVLGLGAVCDNVPYYTNTFYTYDCDFSRLIVGPSEGYICFTETVCHDVANRLLYEGADRDKIKIIESNDPARILSEISEAQTDNIYLITLLHNYEEIEKYLRKEAANA